MLDPHYNTIATPWYHLGSRSWPTSSSPLLGTHGCPVQLRGGMLDPRYNTIATPCWHHLAGIKVMAHILKPTAWDTWVPSAVEGWYVGPVLQLYCCHRICSKGMGHTQVLAQRTLMVPQHQATCCELLLHTPHTHTFIGSQHESHSTCLTNQPHPVVTTSPKPLVLTQPPGFLPGMSLGVVVPTNTNHNATAATPDPTLCRRVPTQATTPARYCGLAGTATHRSIHWLAIRLNIVNWHYLP